MEIAARAVLVTGANRGLGEALVEEALRGGAARVYDTDMSRDLAVPKASPESVARGILDGVERGDEEIFPAPMSAPMSDGWYAGAAEGLERQNATLVPSDPVAS